MNILIYGSCVSRDALEFDTIKEIKLNDYFARSSLASSMSSIKIDNIPTKNIASSFQRRMVESDLNKDLYQVIKNSNYDILLLDFIDERFDLWISPKGAVCTISNELLTSGCTPPKNEVIKSGSEQWFSYWESGWITLLDLLNKTGNIHKLLINEVYWSKSTANGSDYLPTYSSVGIDAANVTLKKIYDRIKRDISHSQLIMFESNDLIGSDSHKWGKSPFHYQDFLYKKIILGLYSNKKNSHDGFVHAPLPFYDFLILSPKDLTQCQLRIVKLTAIKLGLSFIEKNNLILITNASKIDSNIVSGFGTHDNKSIINLSNDKTQEEALFNGIGNYTACIFSSDNQVSIYQDYFGMGSTYYASNDYCAIASNRVHLTFIFSHILGIKKPNKNNIHSKLLDHFFFSGQAFNNETPICDINKTPLNHRVDISGGIISLVKNNFDTINSSLSYEDYLKKGIEEVKSITRSTIDALNKNNSIICCDLSGGKDSRAALAAIMAVHDETFFIRTNDVEGNDDLKISLEIASHCKLSYINHSNDNYFPISYKDGIKIWRSYFMGDYHRMGLPNKSNYGASKTIRIGGGAGEIYRDFWNKIVNKSSAVELSSVIETLLMNEDGRLDKLSVSDKEELYLYVKESLSSEISNNNCFSALSEHYLKFRNRSHFGMRHFTTFNDALYIFPLLSPSLFRASLLLDEQQRESGKLMYDIIDRLHPILNNFYYDGGFPLADKIIKEKIKIAENDLKIKNKEWTEANIRLQKIYATNYTPKIKDNNLNEILDYEVSVSLSRIKFTLQNFDYFIDSMYEKYKKCKKISSNLTRTTSSIIFSIDDALHPLESIKEQVSLLAIEQNGNEYLNPINSCGFKKNGEELYAYISLIDQVTDNDYLFAYYIFQGGVRIHTFWYNDNTEQLLDIKLTENMKVSVFAKHKISNRVFIEEGA